MKAPSDQIHPIASPLPGDEKIHAVEVAEIRHTRRLFLRCCGCVAAVLLVGAVVVVTLIFTLFKLKGPTIRVHKLSIGKLDLAAAGDNVTLRADVWIRNPNFAYFTYGKLTTELFYRGAVVGEAVGPPGKARARRTTRLNVTVEVMTDRILAAPGFDSDLESGLVNFTSYTRVGGKMRVFVLIEKKFTVRMNCNMTFNITSREIGQHRCKRKVKVKV